jgi:protein-S-isoprenylcysteine O-methyltransferase Ste14
MLVVVKAPYGRYVRGGWGPSIHARMAWILMEAPAVFVILFMYLAAEHKPPTATIFILLWQIHYVYRTFVYPILVRGGKKAFPIVLVAMALVFNSANGYVNGWFLFHSGRHLGSSWFADPRFIVGTTLFLVGMYIHTRSDHILRSLRDPGDTDYKIPIGGMYRFLSAPNYFGEILQWFGWAIATWSTAGLAFAVFTLANLLPRGLSHHRWYRDTYPDYPDGRKAVIPFLL